MKITSAMVEAAGKVIYGKEFTGDSEVVRNALEAAIKIADENKIHINISQPTPAVQYVPVPTCRCGGHCGH